jgi:hypothetical protein
LHSKLQYISELGRQLPSRSSFKCLPCLSAATAARSKRFFSEIPAACNRYFPTRNPDPEGGPCRTAALCGPGARPCRTAPAEARRAAHALWSERPPTRQLSPGTREFVSQCAVSYETRRGRRTSRSLLAGGLRIGGDLGVSLYSRRRFSGFVLPLRSQHERSPRAITESLFAANRDGLDCCRRSVFLVRTLSCLLPFSRYNVATHTPAATDTLCGPLPPGFSFTPPAPWNNEWGPISV